MIETHEAGPRPRFALWWLLFGLVAGAGVTAASASTPCLSIDEVRPGMKGIGRTVFQGDSVQEFGVEILAVMKRARPQGDLILFRGQGPILEHAGIIAGMSGSPVYIDGKLIGAVSFAYPLSKDPIGGITPIGEMLDLLHLQPASEKEDQDTAPPAPGKSRRGRGASTAPVPRGTTAGDWGNAEEFQQLWGQFLDRASGETPPAAPRLEDASTAAPSVASGLAELAVPVSMSGWDGSMRAEMSQGLQRLGFMAVPMAGGSGGGMEGNVRKNATVEPGSAFGIQLVGGDASMAAIGTVTYIDGDRLLAFGHPMIQGGPVSMPMRSAWIHTVMANLESSYKLGTTTDPLGTIWEDRRSGVEGTIGQSADVLPVRVTLEPADGPRRVFHFQVVRNPILTPELLPWTVSNAYLAAGWAQEDADARSEITVHFNGDQSVTRVERFQTDAPGTAMGTEIILPANMLLINPFEETRLDSVSVNLSYRRGNVQARITELRCQPRHRAVGDSLHCFLTLQPYRGAPEIRRIDFRVPSRWSEKKLVLIASGAEETMELDRDRAPGKYAPRSLVQLRRLLETVPNDGEVILRVIARGPGNTVRGIEVPTLPPSVVEAGNNEGGEVGVQSASGSVLEERILETPWVVHGRQAIEVEVEQ